jgi:uncharacterized coiled-coil protein SlyX
MADRRYSNSTSPNISAWLPMMGFLLAIGGIVYQSGSVTSEVRQNTARIVALEAKDALREKALSEMNIRGAENATKLNFLVEQAQREQRRDSR